MSRFDEWSKVEIRTSLKFRKVQSKCFSLSGDDKPEVPDQSLKKRDSVEGKITIFVSQHSTILVLIQGREREVEAIRDKI